MELLNTREELLKVKNQIKIHVGTRDYIVDVNAIVERYMCAQIVTADITYHILNRVDYVIDFVEAYLKAKLEDNLLEVRLDGTDLIECGDNLAYSTHVNPVELDYAIYILGGK